MTPRPSWRPLVAAALLLGTAACGSGDQDAPAEPSPVALRVVAAPQKIVIGVVVTLTSDPGQGAEWNEAAEGAAVAGYRYREGGAGVRIVAVNDRGTSEGAAAAVETLVGDHVSGIVLATDGSHVAGALDAARSAGVPMLLPYSTRVSDLPDDAWLTGPDDQQIGSALSRTLEAESVSRPLVIDAGGGTPDGLVASRRIRFTATGDPATLAAKVAGLTSAGPRIDAVVVSGPAQTQAVVVAALQGRALGVPLLLTPQALSPVFATALDQAGGSLSGDLTTVGTDDSDTAALQSGARGSSASAFLAAVRAAASDPDLTDYFDDRSFSRVAADADARSHDAVIALVQAVVKARSTTPRAVASALAGLHLTSDVGLVGPDLSFDQHAALADDQVVTLQSTQQGSGLRPGADDTSRLYWFSAQDR